MKQRVKKLERDFSHPEIWDKGSIKALQELRYFREKDGEWGKLIKIYEEAVALGELLGEGKDRDLEKELEGKVEDLGKRVSKFQIESFFSEKYDRVNAILSIHPGAGGTDSCDWAQVLLRMYLNWCKGKGYNTRLVEWIAGEEAGIKTVTVLVEGKFAFGYLKEEVGIHRLVRISPFDAAKRRHTSFAAVDVIPETLEDEIVIKDNDLKIDTFRAGGPGGQHVNVTDSAVRVTHLPTGVIVQCQNERSQHKNKAMALRVLRSRLHNLYQLEKEKDLKRRYQEKDRIEWGSQVRSYILHPYTLVKDHRTGLEASDVESILNGGIDNFIITSLKRKLNSLATKSPRHKEAI